MQLFYRRELWASKYVGFNGAKSLKICLCKSWCPKDLRVCAPAAPVLMHSLLEQWDFCDFFPMSFFFGNLLHTFKLKYRKTITEIRYPFSHLHRKPFIQTQTKHWKLKTKRKRAGFKHFFCYRKKFYNEALQENVLTMSPNFGNEEKEASDYGNTGCRVFKRGYKIKKSFT